MMESPPRAAYPLDRTPQAEPVRVDRYDGLSPDLNVEPSRAGNRAQRRAFARLK